jgi:hypothetical protein
MEDQIGEKGEAGLLPVVLQAFAVRTAQRLRDVLRAGDLMQRAKRTSSRKRNPALPSTAPNSRRMTALLAWFARHPALSSQSSPFSS